MEFWDIYDENKKPTGRTMKRNDWCLKDGEYHLTVLGVKKGHEVTFTIEGADEEAAYEAVSKFMQENL